MGHCTVWTPTFDTSPLGGDHLTRLTLHPLNLCSKGSKDSKGRSGLDLVGSVKRLGYGGPVLVVLVRLG